jgi:anthranilate phosphoribosyltransferase
MRKHCVRLLHDMDVLEIVGTGGDQSNSFNISTTSALGVSAAGVPVAKHGNRAASSRCGAADVLEALGVDISLAPEKSKEILEKIGICFLFAQNYHLAMKYVAPVRRELGIRTVFNILGPLTNPAGAKMQLLGVYEEELVVPMAQVLLNLGVTNALVVYGQDKLDEISLSAPTLVCEVKGGKTEKYTIEPEDFGLRKCSKKDLVGGDAAENATITRQILASASGAKRDATILNSAAALYVARRADSIAEGVEIAREMIDTGKAKEQLDRFVELSRAT